MTRRDPRTNPHWWVDRRGADVELVAMCARCGREFGVMVCVECGDRCPSCEREVIYWPRDERRPVQSEVGSASRLA
jgi:DNA-directed RNA polymerase subunit RPC12/RpoP